MKRGVVLGAAIAALSLLIAGAPLVASARTRHKKPKPVIANCAIGLVVTPPAGFISPPPGATSGNQFGTLSCPRPLGGGVQGDDFHVTATGPSATTGTVSGTYKQWFNAGTLRGIYNESYSTGVPPITIINYSGTITVTGGTGRFRGAVGSGSITCNSPDSGEHTTCTEHLTLTRL